MHNLSKRKRDRGVILTHQGWQKLQRAKQAVEVQQNWGQRFTFEQLSDRTGLSQQTVSRILKRKEGVDKQSLEYFLRAFSLELSQGDCTPPVSPFEELAARQENLQQDWGEAIDVSLFCGREEELAQLREWVLEEHCRLLTLLGIGGIGKSSLAVKLALSIQTEFEVVIWRSLQNAPPLEELLGSILQSVMRVQTENQFLPTSLDERLAKLMESLRSSRCLLILDNAETILCSGERTGQFRAGYEGYGQLLQYIGEVPHQSCLILTSREKPQEIARLAGEKLPVRSHLLRKLTPAESRELFRQKGQFTGSEAEWSKLVEHYGGNPLALKMVAAATQELFNGRIGGVLDYVNQGTLVFEDIRNLLERQFNRLSEVDREVIYWLAINREPVSLSELREDIFPAASRRKLPAAIDSLLRRSLIDNNADQFSLQPTVMEYAMERFVDLLYEEITTEEPRLLLSHALMKAMAKDYVRESQICLILEPILSRLHRTFKSKKNIEDKLNRILVKIREEFSVSSGYGVGNLINFLKALEALED
ncbi:MAG TPA: NB-ARC domain-containing protein [Allocoleopsis sp.]